ncbi:secretory pathway Sec39 family protein [Pseudomonas marginalis]|uniref:secretory pathway Sec39 family protein n=3 Tax=Pseudomonas TaxID=286 RepID=UPI0021CCFFE0|nr:secretory pathway Sec39 family protein [Pseudomonas marginalis]
MATTRQRNSYQFAAERAEYLSRSGRRHEALSYIQTLRSDETVLPPFAIDELSIIESSLLSQQTNYLPQLTSSQGPTINSVQTDLRTSWLRIRALNANDQSQILMEPNNSIDTYLLQIIEQVGNELLLRNGNLLRKKADAGSSVIPLDDEDMINDWLVSLIKQRMNFVGWTVHDQSRMGWSASGQQVGETDGWIQDGNGNLVSVIEAFRLGDKIDRTVIKKHLDKVCGYNSTGTSPIFIVIYTASDDFPKLCSEYEKYVRNLEYKGFEIGRPRNLRRKIMHMPKATAWYYEEIRYVNDTAINVYHQLLNLKPPSQAI